MVSAFSKSAKGEPPAGAGGLAVPHHMACTNTAREHLVMISVVAQEHRSKAVGGLLSLLYCRYHLPGFLSAEETPFTGTTSTAVGYKIWSDRIALPSDCRETFEVMHNHTNTPMEGIGLQEFRRQQASSPTTEGRPRYYSTGDFHDPDPYAAISGLPAVSTMASAGLVKTIVFASDASSFLKVSDRIEVSGASHFSFNGQVIVSSVSTTAVTYTGTVDYKQVATADTPTIEKLSIECLPMILYVLLKFFIIQSISNSQRWTQFLPSILHFPLIHLYLIYD